MYERDVAPEPPSSNGVRSNGIDPARSAVPWSPRAAGPAAAPRERRSAPDPLLVGLAVRLQAQADRQGTALDRLRAAERNPQALADIDRIGEVVRRSRRDAENLLVVGGASAGPRARPAAALAEVLREATAGVDLPARIVTGPVPVATVASWAVSDLVEVLADVVDHAAEVAAPGVRIDIAARSADSGGLTVEVVIDGPGVPRGDIDALNAVLAGDNPGFGPRPLALLAAARRARRCGLEVRLQERLGGPDLLGPGLISVVRCPADVVRTEPDRWAEPPRNGARPSAPVDDPLFGPVPTGPESPPYAADYATEEPRPLPDRPSADLPWRPEPGPVSEPGPPPPVDDLFGPLVLPIGGSGDDLASTPIYEAVASAWFREGRGGPEAPEEDWTSPGDAEWQAAAERATESENLPTTASGLPRRRPGRQMVAPPRDGAGPAPAASPVERVPDRVRQQLASYQRGLRHGRHRATDGPDEAGDDPLFGTL